MGKRSCDQRRHQKKKGDPQPALLSSCPPHVPRICRAREWDTAPREAEQGREQLEKSSCPIQYRRPVQFQCQINEEYFFFFSLTMPHALFGT